MLNLVDNQPTDEAPPSEYEMVRGTGLVVEMLAGRWRVAVLYLLAGGTRRYSEIYYEVGEVSKKALTQALRGLHRDGLIERRVYAEVPPRVEYSLTRLGWSITGVLMEMHGWSAEHGSAVEQARRSTETDRLAA